MNNLMSPEVMSPEAPRTVCTSLVLVKAEKYIRVGSQWLSENSGKPLDKAHKAINKVERGELEKYFQLSKTKIEDYLNSGKTLLLETPQRGLIRAYHTAALLKKIEETYFAANEIVSFADYNHSTSAYFQLVSNKSLILIQIRLLTSKNNKWVIDSPNFNHTSLETVQRTPTILRRLKLIDEILTFYYQEHQFNSSASIARIEQAIRDKLGRSWKLCDLPHLTSLGGDESSYSSHTVAVKTRDAHSRTPQIQRMSAVSIPLSRPSQFQENFMVPDLAGPGDSGQLPSETADCCRSSSTAAFKPQTPLQKPLLSESESISDNRLGQLKLAPTIFAGGFLTGCMASGFLPWTPMAMEAEEEDLKSEESSQASPRSVVPAAKMSRLMVVPGVMTPKFSPAVYTSSAETLSDEIIEPNMADDALGKKGYAETSEYLSTPQYLPF